MNDNRELKISLELLQMWFAEGTVYREFLQGDQVRKVRVTQGLDPEARIVGAHLDFAPYPMLVLEYDRPIPDSCTFQEVRGE